MSTNKTPNLNLHSWVGADRVLRTEFVENFDIIDEKFSGTKGHTHSPLKDGDGGRIDSRDIIYNEEVNDKRNLREVIDELFQDANRNNLSVATTIGSTYDALGDTDENSMAALFTHTRRYKDEIMNAIREKHGIAESDESLYDYYDRILDIPYNLRPTGTATESTVAAGKTFINNYGTLKTGTHPVFTQEFIPGKQSVSIPDGIHRNSKIKAEPNLKPENILRGNTVFGVTGTLEPKDGLYKYLTYGMEYFLPLYNAEKTVIDSGYKCLESNSYVDHTVFVCSDGCNGSVYTYKRSDTANETFTTTHRSKDGTLKTRNFNVSGTASYFSCDTFNYYYSTSDAVRAFDRNTSTLKWTYTSKDNKMLGAFPAPSGNIWICYVDGVSSMYGVEYSIACVDSETGKVIYTSSLVDYNNMNKPDTIYVDTFTGKLYFVQTYGSVLTEVDLYQDDTKKLTGKVYSVDMGYNWASHGFFKGICTDLEGTMYYALENGTTVNPASAIFIRKANESKFSEINFYGMRIYGIYPYMPYRYEGEPRIDTSGMLVLVTDKGVKVYSVKKNLMLEVENSDVTDILQKSSTAMDDRGNVAYIDKDNMAHYHIDFIDKFKVVNPRT